MKEIVSLALASAKSQIGVREQPLGSNRGPQVSKYLGSVGLGGGYAWCMAFDFWNAQEAARELRLKNPLPKTAYCPDLANWASERHCLFSRPEPGDFMLSYSSPEGYLRASHTGIVESVDGDDFTSIEGNTNLDGGREGNGVYRKHRRAGSRYKFVRWNLVAPLTAAEGSKAVFLPHPEPAHVAPPPIENGDQLLLPNGAKGALTKIDGVNYLGVRAWAGMLGIACDWDADQQIVLLQGRDAPLDLYKRPVGGTFVGMAPIRQLAEFSGLKVSYNPLQHLVIVSR